MSAESTFRPQIKRFIILASIVLLIGIANGLFEYPSRKSEPADGIACERLTRFNQTKILCYTRTKTEKLEKIRVRQEQNKDTRVCTKIFNMVQR